jgi:hypothetical protein
MVVSVLLGFVGICWNSTTVRGNIEFNPSVWIASFQNLQPCSSLFDLFISTGATHDPHHGTATACDIKEPTEGYTVLSTSPYK